MERRSYVYVYFRRNGVPCYVGKGSGDRWRVHAKPSNAGSHLHNLIQQAKTLGCELPVVIIRDGLYESEAYEIESALISALGRECDGGLLVNLSEGGKGGALGVVHGPEFRQKRREHMLRHYVDHPEAKLEVSRRAKGNRYNADTPRTPEWSGKISQSLTGNQRTKGHRLTEEHKAKIGAGVRGKKQTPEWVAKRIAATVETKRKKASNV